MKTESPTGKPSAREHILEIAGALFFREGYRAVGVDTIIAAAGIAKMTLYRYFPSKDDLIVAYLEKSNERFWEWFDSSLGAGTPDERLGNLFDQVGILANRPDCYGCAFQTTAAEFPDIHHPGHAVAIRHKRQVIERLAELATAAAIPEPERLAEQLLLLMDGAFVSARVFGSPNPSAQVGPAARILIAAHIAQRQQA